MDFEAPLHVFFQRADSRATAPTLKRREHSVICLPLGFIWHRHIPWWDLSSSEAPSNSQLSCADSHQMNFGPKSVRMRFFSLTFSVPLHTLAVKYSTWRAGEQSVLIRGQQWHLNCSFRKRGQVEQNWKRIFPYSIKRKREKQKYRLRKTVHEQQNGAGVNSLISI